jgi:glycosyltransferase involved in cell wall biosynthesis
VAVVGVSLRATCGVRDHATLLAGALAGHGVSCELHWLQREVESAPAARRRFAEFSARLAAELERDPPDAVIVHYSVFAYSYKGVPLFVRPVFEALRRCGRPVIVIMHEFAYPWWYGGLRGAVWAVTQRALVVEVMRAATSVIVTAEWRAVWLASRRWLPSRPARFAPVFSNLPTPTAHARPGPGEPQIGLFGYAYQGAAMSLILDALAAVRARGVSATLRLLGAPGRESASGEGWLEQAHARDLAGAVSFSGRLPPQELADALAACHVLLFADAAGPSSRKGTLAGSLASGRPVVAFDGPLGWRALKAAGAVELVAVSPAALANAVVALLQDPAELEALGARGRAFYEREMALERTAEVVLELLAEDRQAASAAA